MDVLRKMTFLAFDHQPNERQSSTIIDDTDHQGQTATTNDTAIHDQREGVLAEIGEQGFGDGKEPGIESGLVMLEEATKAGDEAFLVSAVGGSMIGDSREMGVAGTSQATHHRYQGVEVAFTMTGGSGLIELHEALFDGMIAAIRVTHGGAPPD